MPALSGTDTIRWSSSARPSGQTPVQPPAPLTDAQVTQPPAEPLCGSAARQAPLRGTQARDLQSGASCRVFAEQLRLGPKCSPWICTPDSQQSWWSRFGALTRERLRHRGLNSAPAPTTTRTKTLARKKSKGEVYLVYRRPTIVLHCSGFRLRSHVSATPISLALPSESQCGMSHIGPASASQARPAGGTKCPSISISGSAGRGH